MVTSSRRDGVEKKILAFCNNEFKPLGEIANMLDMNVHTVRSVYLYPMANGGRLIRSASQPIKSGMKYKAAPRK